MKVIVKSDILIFKLQNHQVPFEISVQNCCVIIPEGFINIELQILKKKQNCRIQWNNVFSSDFPNWRTDSKPQRAFTDPGSEEFFLEFPFTHRHCFLDKEEDRNGIQEELWREFLANFKKRMKERLGI
jgi:hypothetical protein